MRVYWTRISAPALLLWLVVYPAGAAEIAIALPEGVPGVESASAATPGGTAKGQARITDDRRRVLLTNLQAGETHSITLKLTGGVTLCGVDLSWYAPTPDATPADALSDENRADIGELLTVPSFYDRTELLLLQGDRRQATGLIQLVRDRDFHAGRGQVIWRVELWYFKYQAGGWEIVQQQAKVLRRERFASVDAYRAATAPLRWLTVLGGIRLEEAETRAISLPADAAEAQKPLFAASRPAR